MTFLSNASILLSINLSVPIFHMQHAAKYAYLQHLVHKLIDFHNFHLHINLV